MVRSTTDKESHVVGAVLVLVLRVVVLHLVYIVGVWGGLGVVSVGSFFVDDPPERR